MMLTIDMLLEDVRSGDVTRFGDRCRGRRPPRRQATAEDRELRAAYSACRNTMRQRKFMYTQKNQPQKAALAEVQERDPDYFLSMMVERLIALQGERERKNRLLGDEDPCRDSYVIPEAKPLPPPGMGLDDMPDSVKEEAARLERLRLLQALEERGIDVYDDKIDPDPAPEPDAAQGEPDDFKPGSLDEWIEQLPPPIEPQGKPVSELEFRRGDNAPPSKSWDERKQILEAKQATVKQAHQQVRERRKLGGIYVSREVTRVVPASSHLPHSCDGSGYVDDITRQMFDHAQKPRYRGDT